MENGNRRFLKRRENHRVITSSGRSVTMAKVNSPPLARSKDQPSAQDPDDHSTWIPESTILGYLRGTVRENDRLDNDREV